jgi:hypothetical protein
VRRDQFVRLVSPVSDGTHLVTLGSERLPDIGLTVHPLLSIVNGRGGCATGSREPLSKIANAGMVSRFAFRPSLRFAMSQGGKRFGLVALACNPP